MSALTVAELFDLAIEGRFANPELLRRLAALPPTARCADLMYSRSTSASGRTSAAATAFDTRSGPTPRVDPVVPSIEARVIGERLRNTVAAVAENGPDWLVTDPWGTRLRISPER